MAPSPAKVAHMASRRRAAQMFALATLGSTAFYLSGATGGEKGVNAQWCAFVMLDPRTPASVLRRVTGCWVGSSGWTLDLLASGALQTLMADGSGTTYKSATLTPFTPIEFGRVCCAFIQYDGANLRIERDRASFSAATAMTAMVPMSASIPQGIGNNGEGASGGATNLAGGYYYASATFAGSPTLAQRQAYWDAARTLGDLPSSLGGCTLRHRASVRDALAGQAVTDGQTAPASIADTATGLSADAFARTGTPTVKVVDTSIDGRKSYGVLGSSTSSGLQTAVAAGLAGAAGGMWVGWYGRLDALSTADASALVERIDASLLRGWTLQSGVANYGNLRFAVGDGTTLYISSQYAAVSADVGIPQLILGHMTAGGKLQLWMKRAQVGSDVSAILVPATTVPTTVGRRSTSILAAENSTMFQVAGGNVALTNAEILQLFDDVAAGKSLEVAGKTAWRLDPTQDVAANGGADAGVPATVNDRVGTGHASRVGSDLRVSRRTDRLWSYETTPVLVGARNLSLTNYLSVATALTGTAVPYWIAFAVMVHAKAGGTYQILCSKARADGQLGANFYGALTFGQLQYTHGLASGTSPLSITYTVPDSEVGRVILLGYQWTGANLQGFVKRGRNGGDVAAATFAPWTGAMTIGRHTDTTANPATDNATILGVMGGINLNITLAEWQAAYDAYVAEEDFIAVPGKTSRLWSHKRAGALAVVDAQGSGETFSVNGAPVISSNYARAIAA